MLHAELGDGVGTPCVQGGGGNSLVIYKYKYPFGLREMCI